MSDWKMNGGDVAVELKDGGCFITGRWGSSIEIKTEDIGRLIYLLNLAAEELDANY